MTISYLALLLLVLITGWRSHTHTQMASASLFPASLKSQEASAAFQRFVKANSNAVQIDDASLLAKADAPADEVIDRLRETATTCANCSPERARQIAAALEQFHALRSRSQAVYSKAVGFSGNVTDDNWAQVGEVGKDMGAMEDSLRALTAALSNDFQVQLNSVSFWSKVQRILGLILLLLFAPCAFLIMFTMEHRVSIPLQKLTDRFKEIAGDLTGAEAGLRGGDEISELDISFSAMVEHLNDMAIITAGIADGDLAQPIHARSQHDALGKSLAEMAESLAGLVTTVRDSALQVSSGSAQVAEAADGSAKTGVQASSAIDTVSCTMQEMNTNVQNVVRGMETQAKNVNETSASINQMVVSIQCVADTSENAGDLRALTS